MMEDEEDDNIIVRQHRYRGEEDVIDDDVTHLLIIDGFVKLVPEYAFQFHPNLIEVFCNRKVEMIEESAFSECQSLERVIMYGVKIVKQWAFYDCLNLTDVECDELEIIEDEAFQDCTYLNGIDVSSVRVVKQGAFDACISLTDAMFGSKLERIEARAFGSCFSLERLTIPLKDGIISDDRIFQDCEKLRRVDLVEGPMHETVAALQLEDWKTGMNEEIDAINQILPSAAAGSWEADHAGGKAIAIRLWIKSVLRRIIRYQEEHRRILDEAGSILQHSLPGDIVMKNVLPFLELPPYTFEMENDDDDSDSDEGDLEEDDV